MGGRRDPKTASYRAYLTGIRRRRADFLAGKQCGDCGGTDYLQARWAVPPGPIAVCKVWQTAAAKRPEYLLLLRVQCHTCRNRESASKQRNEHGGGAQGISKCKCKLCLKRRSEYAAKWKRDKRARQKALKALPNSPRGTLGQ